VLAEEGRDAQVLEKLTQMRAESAELALTIEAEKQRSDVIPADFVTFMLTKWRDTDTSTDAKTRAFLTNFVTRVEVSKSHITVEILYKDEYDNPFMRKM
jgi:hypothetical protein